MNDLNTQVDTKHSIVDNNPGPVPSVSIFATIDIDPFLTEALSAQGFQLHQFDPEAVADALKSSGSAEETPPCVILWNAPVRRLAAAIRKGTRPEQVLADWCALATILTALMRHNRRKLLLLDSRTLTVPDAEPERAMLRKRLGLADLVLPVAAPATDSPEVDALPQVLAQLFIAKSDVVRETLEELQASGIAPPADGVSSDLLSGGTSDFVRLSAARQETMELRNRFNKQAQDLEAAIRAAENRKAEAAAAREELRVLRTQLAVQSRESQDVTRTAESWNAETAATEEELRLLRAQFAKQAQEQQLSVRRTESQAVSVIVAREELRLLKAQCAKQAQDLQRVSKNAESDHAEALATGEELRLLRERFAAQARDLQKVSQTAENERAQAAAAKQELRLLYDQFAMQSQELRMAARSLNNLRGETEARQRLQGQCDLLTQRVGDLSSHLDAVFASNSWRITRPIRAIKRRITREGKPIDLLIAEEGRDPSRR